MNIKPIFEFIVWENCNNHCQFCFQRENAEIINNIQKKKNLETVLSFLDSDKYVKGCHLLIVGGEIFDNPKMFPDLKVFFDNIFNRILKDEIEVLYINTNLIYQDISICEYVLDKFKEHNILDRIHFTTSYDLKGRFKTEEDRFMMLDNVRTLGAKYPRALITNIILTEDVCNKILSNKFDIMNFRESYNTEINLIPYIILDNSLTADRNLIFKTLKHVERLNPTWFKWYATNTRLIQKRELYKVEKGNLVYKSCADSECGHSINFKRYSNKGSCFICDFERIFKGV